MADCFISYRRTPSAPVATTLQSKLESKYGIDAYVDTTRTDSTKVRFPERLMSAIADAPVFVCLLGERDGEHTLDSEWVLKEIQQAYDLQKFCIPVFQESYRPLPDMPPAVDYLLGFDGVHYLDQKNIMIDESVRQLAGLIQPHVRKRRNPWITVVGMLLMLALGTGVAAALIQASQGNDTNLIGEPTTAVAQNASETPTDAFTLTVSDVQPVQDTETPTATPTETLEPTLTETPDILAAAQQVLEQQTAQAVIDSSTATAAFATQQVELQQTESANLTATATLWTNTPTPNITASVEAVLTDWAHGTATQDAINLTATATLWTLTPTATHTSTATHTPTATPTATSTPTATLTLSPTYTPTATPTMTSTPTLSPEQIASIRATHNADWTPIQHNFNGVTMVLVPAGCFMMGSDDGSDDEHPVHEQCFDQPFWIDKYEVTRAQFRRLGGIKRYPDGFSGENRPVERIKWFEARDFCALRGARLPTEREWEYAARGPDEWDYPWGDTWNANNTVWNRSVEEGTTNVGSIPAGRSWVGVLDMSGNVSEWVSSLYLPYDSVEDREADTGDRTDVERVLRGGSWFNNNTDYLRAAYRNGFEPDFRFDFIGFRCARSIE